MTSGLRQLTSSTAPRRGRSVWRVRDFRLFWAAETVSAAGTGIGAVALPVVAVAVLHAGPAAVGFLEAAVWAPWLLLGLPAGVLVDRVSTRGLMIACDVVAAGAFLTVPAAAAGGHLRLGWLLGVAAVTGSVNVVSQAARPTYPQPSWPMTSCPPRPARCNRRSR